jgi:hypothetical protein
VRTGRRRSNATRTEVKAMSVEALVGNLRTVIDEGWKVQQRIAEKAGLSIPTPQPKGDEDVRRD